MLLVFGGDGEMLSTARRLGTNQIPALGINFGKLGFLTQFDACELESALPSILGGDFTVGERMMLDCSLLRGEPKKRQFLALNDVVISRGALSRLVRLRLYVDGEPATSYASDGLIISTPVGSTAHSLSAGGPILEPDFEAMIITPICAHSLANRPVVICAGHAVEVHAEKFTQELGLTVDGQVYEPLEPGDRIRVVRSSHKFLQVIRRTQAFYRTLRGKLGWGGTIENQNSPHPR